MSLLFASFFLIRGAQINFFLVLLALCSLTSQIPLSVLENVQKILQVFLLLKFPPSRGDTQV